jgi:hypothetical protein
VFTRREALTALTALSASLYLRSLPSLHAQNRELVWPVGDRDRPTTDTEEAGKIMPFLNRVKYPVRSRSELVSYLGGPEARVTIEGVVVSPSRMTYFLKDELFPIKHEADFRAKIEQTLNANRDKVNVAVEAGNIRRSLPPLQYPIENAEELVNRLGDKQFRFQNRVVLPRMAMVHLPSSAFPIASQDDFFAKIERLISAMANRPLISEVELRRFQVR